MRSLVLSLLLITLPILAAPIYAADSESALVYIGYKANQGEPLELQFNFQGEIPNPSYFTSESPARITFDFTGVKNQLPWTLPLKVKGGGNVQSITAVEAGGRTRVVINLNSLVEYQTREEGGSLFIAMGSAPAESQSNTQDELSSTDAVDEPNEPEPEALAKTDLTLNDISYQSLSGNKLEINLAFSSSAPQPNAFTIDNPPRLVLDLPLVSSAMQRSHFEVGIGAAKSVTAVEVGDRTRVIVNLINSVSYEILRVGNDLKLIIDNPSLKTKMLGGSETHAIETIDFRRGDNGQGRIVVQLSGANVITDTRLLGSKIIVEFINTSLPENLARRYDVLDFSTPIQFFEAQGGSRNAQLVVEVGSEFDYLAFQANKSFTLEVKVPDVEPQLKKKDGVYIGDKLSLNFQDIEVRAVLQLIADFTGLNMVASDSVTGNLTLRLKNVPWDQALDIILRTKGLAMRQDGNVILIGPSDEMAAREKMELESQRQIDSLEPIRTELIQVNYAKASDLMELMVGGEGLLSARGKVSVDERTNMLIMTDISRKREEVRLLIQKLDVPIRQVMIDARIVIATSDFSRDLGVRFGVTGVEQSGSSSMMISGTSAAASGTMIESAMDPATSVINVPAGEAYEQRLNVNMPVVSPSAGRFALSILSGGSLLDLELSALQAEGRGELISSPRVVTSNGKEALIEQGTEIPYLEASSSGAATVSFKKAVLSLTVTPQITPDDRVLMDLRVSKDSVGTVFSNIPSIDTKEIVTQILVRNGDTVVLGGVYEQISRESVTKVPLLGDIPILGALFRNTSKSDEKIELLIFVTPKILQEGSGLN